jgi:hypothetical protein
MERAAAHVVSVGTTGFWLSDPYCRPKLRHTRLMELRGGRLKEKGLRHVNANELYRLTFVVDEGHLTSSAICMQVRRSR